MNLCYNNYQKLKQQNADEIAGMSEKNWGVINRMMQYISSYNVSLFEMEVIKKDLIGAAKEADMESIELGEKLGVPEKEFCDSLIQAGMKRSRFELILPMLQRACLWLTAIYVTGFLADGLPGESGIRWWEILLLPVGMQFDVIIDRYIIGRSAYSRKYTKAIGNILILVIDIVLLVLFSPGKFDGFLIRGNGWGILAVLFVLNAVIFWSNNYYWNKCSRNYRWE